MRKDRHEVICFIGIGANEGDEILNCRKAVQNIESLSHVKLLQQSSTYITEPVGKRDQNWFINKVIEIRTSFTAETLLAELQTIETLMGRVRHKKWGPRVIDLDILLYGQEIINQTDLIIPHPEMYKRRFVLVPLNEIAAYVIHPVFGISIKGLLERLVDESTVKLLDNGYFQKPERYKH